MSLRWSSYVAPKSPKGNLKNAKRSICVKKSDFAWRKWPRWCEIADFRSLFARSDWTVTPSEKSSINTNRKSTTRFPMSLTWTSYVIPKPPKGWLENAKCPKFEQLAAKTPKRYEIGCQLLLITNRKLHTSFRLAPTSMTLNDLERRNSSYFAFFSPNLTDFQADYITVVEYRPIVFPSSSPLLLAKSRTRSLCDS